MHRFQNIEIWKKSRLFCSEIYTVTSKFPESEKFGLTNLRQRASVTIPSNSAKGSTRHPNKQFVRFLKITSGSAYGISGFLHKPYTE